jgi:hypothetical protein
MRPIPRSEQRGRTTTMIRAIDAVAKAGATLWKLRVGNAYVA